MGAELLETHDGVSRETALIIDPGFARLGAFVGVFPTRASTCFRNVGSNPLNSFAGTASGSMIQRSGPALPFHAYAAHPSGNTKAGPSPRCSSCRSFTWSSDGRSLRMTAFWNGHQRPEERATSWPQAVVGRTVAMIRMKRPFRRPSNSSASALNLRSWSTTTIALPRLQPVSALRFRCHLSGCASPGRSSSR